MSDYDDFQEPDLDELLGTGLDDDLFQAAFGANQNVTEVTARHEPTPAPPPPVPLHPSIPACIHCGKAAMSNDVTRTFGLQICRLCSKGPRYQLIAKTRAKETYLLTDEDFDGKLKYIMRENPNKAGWSTMHLFLLSEVNSLLGFLTKIFFFGSNTTTLSRLYCLSSVLLSHVGRSLSNR